jgi:DNA primase
MAGHGLIDTLERDTFFGCLTFPLPETGNLYGRSIEDGVLRHRFLPRPKGGLYGWAAARAFSSLILAEGLLDVAALWQAGFANAVAALGAHLNAAQLAQLCEPGRRVYVCLDADRNGSGPRAARWLCARLASAGVEALRVLLPAGHDPNSFFAAGAGRADFQRCLDRARP